MFEKIMRISKDDVLGTISKGKRPGIVLVKGIDAEGNVTKESTSERVI